MANCVICNHETSKIIDKQINVTHSYCEHCGFIYKDKKYHLEKAQEIEQYQRHNNSFESKGYVNMFKQFIDQHIRPLNVKGKALEFGSGPGPVLSELLKQEEGLEVWSFDPFFNCDIGYRRHKFNLITCTEVVEHFYNPIKEFRHLAETLAPGGYLVVMTKIRNMSRKDFLTWWYRRDYTHVSFYHKRTFKHIAKECGLDIIFYNNENTIIYQKKAE